MSSSSSSSSKIRALLFLIGSVIGSLPFHFDAAELCFALTGDFAFIRSNTSLSSFRRILVTIFNQITMGAMLRKHKGADK